MNQHHTCPVCGFDGLESQPKDHYGCPCCATIFGFHDEACTHAELRVTWINDGMQWRSKAWPAPAGWDARKQLGHAGFLTKPNAGPHWTETFDDDDNSIWEAPSPRHDEGSYMYWRLKQRLVGNRIEWYEAHDGELMGSVPPESWPSLEEAKAAIAEGHANIQHEISQNESEE